MFTFLVGFLGLCAALRRCAGSPSPVIELDSSKFAGTIASHDLVMVKFYTTWDVTSAPFAPVFEEAARELEKVSIPTAQVDCGAKENFMLCLDENINAYPVMKIYQKDHESAFYNGDRTAEDIVAYMTKLTMPLVKDLDSSNFDAFVRMAADRTSASNKRMVVVQFADEQDTGARAMIQGLAYIYSGSSFLFAQTSDRSVLQAENVLDRLAQDNQPVLALYHPQNDDAEKVVYTGDLDDLDELNLFMHTNSLPTMKEITMDNFDDYAEFGLPVALLFVDRKTNNDELVSSIKSVARELRGKVNFVWIDVDVFRLYGESLGLSRDKWPAFAIQHLTDGSKYPLDQDIEVNAENIRNFVTAFAEGKLKPRLSSEPIPAKQSGNVYRLVGKEFDKIALDRTRDVFLKIDAPECDFCTELDTIWEQVGDKFEKSKHEIVVASLDGTKNDMSPEAGLIIVGFPNVLFKPAHSDYFLDFDEDEWTVDSLVSFAVAHSGNNVKAQDAFEHGRDEL